MAKKERNWLKPEELKEGMVVSFHQNYISEVWKEGKSPLVIKKIHKGFPFSESRTGYMVEYACYHQDNCNWCNKLLVNQPVLHMVYIKEDGMAEFPFSEETKKGGYILKDYPVFSEMQSPI